MLDDIMEEGFGALKRKTEDGSTWFEKPANGRILDWLIDVVIDVG